MPQKMSQAEFIRKLKEQMPELKSFSDFDIIAGIAKRRPDILEKVEGPNETRARADVLNAKAQAEAEKGSHFFSNSALGAAAKSGLGYLRGAVVDLPGTFIHGIPSTIQSFVEAASNPALAVSKGIPTVVDTAQNMWNTTKNAGADPQAFGRMMGQLTGQPIVSEAALGGIPKGTFGLKSDIPSGLKVSTAAGKAGVRAAGRTLSNIGGAAIDLAKVPYPVPRSFRWSSTIGGGGLQKIGNRLAKIGITPEQFRDIALETSPNVKYFPSNETPRGLTPDEIVGNSVKYNPSNEISRPLTPDEIVRSNVKSTSINEPSRQFKQRLPADTDLGFRSETTEQANLPFGETPSGEWVGPRQPSESTTPFEEGNLPLGDPTWKTYPRAGNKITIQSPTPFKLAEAKANGFVPSTGTTAVDGSIELVREGAPTAKTPAAAPEPTTGPPELISVNGLSTEQVKTIQGTGLYEYSQDAKGFGQFKLKKGAWEAKGQMGGKEPGPTTSADTFRPTEDWKTTYKNLRQMLGRDPSAAEIEAAQGRSVQPGEQTGRVAPFEPETTPSWNKRWTPEESQSEPVDSTKLQQFLENAPWKEDAFGPKPEIPPLDKWDEPGLDVSQTRKGNVLGPRAVGSGDVPVMGQQGQQELPLGPHSEMFPRELQSDIGMGGPDEPLVRSSLSEPMQQSLGLRSPTMYHGTQRDIQSFSPLHESEGEFPTMTHFSEDPAYSQEYAYGWHSGGPKGMGERVQIPHSGNLTEASLKGARPNLVPANIDATSKVLDFTKGLHPEDEAIINKVMGTDQWSINELRDMLDDPDFASQLPYDAYRYDTHGAANWAIPHKTPVQTPWGVPLKVPEENFY